MDNITVRSRNNFFEYAVLVPLGVDPNDLNAKDQLPGESASIASVKTYSADSCVSNGSPIQFLYDYDFDNTSGLGQLLLGIPVIFQ